VTKTAEEKNIKNALSIVVSWRAHSVLCLELGTQFLYKNEPQQVHFNDLPVQARGTYCIQEVFDWYPDNISDTIWVSVGSILIK
jgi:hypothetical protein